MIRIKAAILINWMTLANIFAKGFPYLGHGNVGLLSSSFSLLLLFGFYSRTVADLEPCFRASEVVTTEIDGSDNSTKPSGQRHW